MTPARFLLILVVVVVVLFGVTLALRNKTGNAKANQPTNSWVSRFNEKFEERQKLDPAKDLTGSCWHGNPLLVAPGQECVLEVAYRKGRSVRKAELRVTSPNSLALNYQPSAEDPEAVALEIKNVDPKKPVRLIFQEHGGTLRLKNPSPTANVSVTIN